MGLLEEVALVGRGWRWGHRPLPPRGAAGDFEGREFRTDWARSALGRAGRTVAQSAGFFPVLRSEVKMRAHGLEVLGSLDPPVIFVSNHSSHLDAPVILASLPPSWRRRAAVGAATDYFFDVWWRSAFTILVFNAFPVERRAGRRSARKARELIKGGWSLVLFPEGTRSRDGWVGNFRAGAAWLAIENGVPVIPIGITGAHRAMPPGRGWPVPGRPAVDVRFGRPLRAEPGERAAAFNERVRAGLAEVLAEGGSSWWEALREAAGGELPDPAGPQAARWRRMWETSAPPRNAGERSPWPGR